MIQWVVHYGRKQPRIQTEVLGHSLVRLLAPLTPSLVPLTPSLAPPCSLPSRALQRSLVRSLSPFTHSFARGTVNDRWLSYQCFISILNHSASHTAPCRTRDSVPIRLMTQTTPANSNINTTRPRCVIYRCFVKRVKF